MLVPLALSPAELQERPLHGISPWEGPVTGMGNEAKAVGLGL